MATVTNTIWSSAEASVDVSFSDVNGAISQLTWRVDAGTLVLTIHQSGKPDITRNASTSGSAAVPAGYNLVKGRKGDWGWPADPSFEISWHR